MVNLITVMVRRKTLKLGKLATAIVLGLGCYGVPVMAQEPNKPVPNFEFSEVRKETLAQALAVAQEITDPRVKGRVLGEIALQYAQIGQAATALSIIAEAEKVVRSIETDNVRVLAMADLAGLYTMLGETEAAGVLLEEAVQTAREVGDNGERGKLLAAIDLKYAQIGENDIAANLLEDSEVAIALSKEPVPLFPFEEIPWTGSVSLGGNLASGNNTTALANLNFIIERKWPQDQIDLSLGFSNNFDDSRSGGDRNRIKAEIDAEFRHHYNDGRWQYFIRSSAMRDELNNINLRTSLYAGPGVNLWRGGKGKTFDMQLGLGIRFEDSDQRNEDLDVPVLTYGLRYKNLFLGSWKFRQLLTFEVPIAHTADYYLTSSTSLGIPISSQWSFSNSLQLRYAAQPTGNNTNLRVNFITGLRYQF